MAAAGQDVLAAYHWEYDSANRITDFYSRADSSAGTPDATYGENSNWGRTSYTYDPTNQLTGTSYTNFQDAPTSNTGQLYDSNGNRTADANLPAGEESERSSSNRLLFDGDFYYTYDAEGNRTAKYQLDENDEPVNVTAYEWNHRNELVVVNLPGGGEVDYAYDAFGRMVSRSPEGISGEGVEKYVYDGANLALVLTSAGRVIERDLYGPAVDMILAMESPLPLGEGQGEGVLAGPVTWPLADNQGTIRDVAEYDDGTGTTSVINHLVYDAFGQIDSQTSAVDQPRFTYTGRPFDSVVDLYNYRARWYDAVNGVFASADPIGFAGGDANLSRYCGNSPANHTDPSGLAWTDPGGPFGYRTSDGAEVERLRHREYFTRTDAGMPFSFIVDDHGDAWVARRTMGKHLLSSRWKEVTSYDQSPSDEQRKVIDKILHPPSLFDRWCARGSRQFRDILKYNPITGGRYSDERIAELQSKFQEDPVAGSVDLVTTAATEAASDLVGRWTAKAAGGLGKGVGWVTGAGNSGGGVPARGPRPNTNAVPHGPSTLPIAPSTQGGLSQSAKTRLAKELGGIPRSAQPAAQGRYGSGTRWWEYKDSNGKTKIVVQHPDGSVHVGTPKPQSLHRTGGPPKYYSEPGSGHVGD